MLSFDIEPTETSYEILVGYYCRQGYFELALQKMAEMGDKGMVASLKLTQAVILLACDMNYPRLAIELANMFETSSIRRLDGSVWIKCLVAAAEGLYVRRLHILSFTDPQILL